MASLGDAKAADTLAPMSEAAVFNLLEFHNRLNQAGKLRSREVQAPFMASFLAEKKRSGRNVAGLNTGPQLDFGYFSLRDGC